MIQNPILRTSLAIAFVFLLSPFAFAQLSPNADRGFTYPSSGASLRDGIVIVENIDGLRVALIDPNEVDLTQELAQLPRGLYYLVDPNDAAIREEYVVE